jgi:myo-inositol-1(or 4)-monophosphatase
VEDRVEYDYFLLFANLQTKQSWDVCAGIVILQEAGGIAVGSKKAALSSLSSPTFAKVDADVLQGRKYLIVRGVGDYKGESGRDAQKRIVKSFYETIDEWDAV